MRSEPKHQKTGNGRTEVFSGKDAVPPPGRSPPRIDAAERIIAVFGLTLDYLYLGDVGTLRHSVVVHLNEGDSGLKPGTKREAKS